MPKYYNIQKYCYILANIKQNHEEGGCYVGGRCKSLAGIPEKPWENEEFRLKKQENVTYNRVKPWYNRYYYTMG